MQLVPLHGAAGVWDEVVCLVVPATAIMGVALAVLRQQPHQDADTEDTIDDTDQPAPAQAAADAGDVAGGTVAANGARRE